PAHNATYGSASFGSLRASVSCVNDGNPHVHIFKPRVTVLSAMRMIPSSLSWLITPQKFPSCISGAAYAMPIVGQFLKWRSFSKRLLPRLKLSSPPDSLADQAGVL